MATIPPNGQIRLRQSSNVAYSVAQAAEITSLSTRTLWRLIKQGKIATVRASARRRVILASELDRYFAQCVAKAA